MKRLGLSLGLLGLAGCVSAINTKEAQIHYEAAQQYDSAGNFAAARDQYWMALVDARLADLDQATISMLTYNYGRTAGYTCKPGVAGKYLLESLELEEGVTGPDSANTTRRLFELARFHYDQADYQEAVHYYKEGLPKVVALGIEESDPIAFADALDEYSVALTRAGRPAEAVAPKERAAALRAENPGATASFVPARYLCIP